MFVDVRILILNTSLAQSEPIERELQKAGVPFATKEIKTRPEFIDTMRETTPDLLLNHCLFPEYDGLSALQLAKDLAPALPFVVLADARDDRAAEECLAKGAALFITPTDYEPLIALVRQRFVEKGGVLPSGSQLEEKQRSVKTNETTSSPQETKPPEKSDEKKHVAQSGDDPMAQLDGAVRRVKDTLNIISSLLFLESRQLRDDIENARAVFNRSRARLKILALLYGQLHESKAFSRADFKTYLENIVSALREIYDASPDALQNNTVGELPIRVERASLAGLIVTELLIERLAMRTNNEQRGTTTTVAAESSGGSVTIRLDADGASAFETSDEHATENFSLRLVKLLAQELQATIETNGQRIAVKFEA